MAILNDVVFPFDSVVVDELNHWFGIAIFNFDCHRLNRQSEFTEAIIVLKRDVVPQILEVLVPLTRIIWEPR